MMGDPDLQGDPACAIGVGGGIGVIALLFMLFLIFRLLLRGRTSSPSVQRARTEVRSLTGENLATILAVLTLSQLVFEYFIRNTGAGVGGCLGSGALAVFAAIILMGLVVAGPFTRALLSTGGIVAFIALAYIEDGPEEAALFLALAAVLLLVLGALRGFIR